MRLSLPLSAAAALLALSAATATADVRDDAGYFSPDAVAKANEVIKDIKREFQKDLVIESFRHAPADKPDAASADPKVKDRFFADWTLQQAREEQVNGIYVLICKEPPYIKPAVGNRTHAMFSDEDRDRLGQILVEHFKKKDYDDGLLEAVHYVHTALKEPEKAAERRPAGQSAPPVWPPPGGNRPAAGGFSLGGLGGLLCVGLVVIAVIGVIWMAMSALGRAFHQGPVGYGPGGYGQGGYGPGGGMGGYGAPGGGGGFMSSVLGGLFGGAAGSWAYDRFFGGHSSSAPTQGYGPGPGAAPEPPSADTDYSAGGGGDFGGGGGVGGGGGDFGGGGGGGDFGGGGGGGDFGGGGGNAGGGGGF